MNTNRREFLKNSGKILTGIAAGGLTGFTNSETVSIIPAKKHSRLNIDNELEADLVILGGGTGGCAAALSAVKQGLRVIMTEPTGWIGGQLTSQLVPPDENPWIESFGASASYRQYRKAVRDFYRNHYPLTEEQRNNEQLNPGNGWVSAISHEPAVSLAVLETLMAPWISAGQLTILRQHHPTAAETDGEHIRAVEIKDLRTDDTFWASAPWFIDATEMGDLLKIASVEYVTGAEGREQTGELHAPESADPDNMQAFNLCFILEHIEGENFTIDKPERYGFWRDYTPDINPPWPGPLFSLTYTHPMTLKPRTLPFDPDDMGWWTYRQIIDPANFADGFYRGPISCINWPQHAYLKGKLIDEPQEKIDYHVEQARQLNLSLLYWLQTEAPRPDGGQGWPGLRLRPDSAGSRDGMAMHPYIRESRRIKARFTVMEQHVGTEARMEETGLAEDEVYAKQFEDSVGIGAYRIDLHPSTKGNNYIDISSLPFQIPLGSLIPVRMRNLLPACKNIGTTHITNGCYRLHPVEWNIGESAGALAGFCQTKGREPHQVYESENLVREFQELLTGMGVRLAWPLGEVYPL